MLKSQLILYDIIQCCESGTGSRASQIRSLGSPRSCKPIFKRHGILRFTDMTDYSQLEFMYNWEQKWLPLTFIGSW